MIDATHHQAAVPANLILTGGRAGRAGENADLVAARGAAWAEHLHPLSSIAAALERAQ